jgi:hypothetical protein
MKNHISLSANTPKQDIQQPSYLLEKHQEHGWLRWWYRLASLPEPEQQASFEERELFRRSRTNSQVILALYGLVIFSIPSAVSGSNWLLSVLLVVGACSHTLAAMLNRLKRVNVAGVMIVTAVWLVPALNIATTPGGLGLRHLPIFALFIMPLVIAATVLPAWCVFIMASLNCSYTLFAMYFFPRKADLSAALSVAPASIFTPLFLGQIMVATVAFIWVTGAVRALTRADRAEEIARLEHDLARQAGAIVQQKQLLDGSITTIIETHTRIANGDFNARVPLTQENVLWQISGSLNNLLARFQRLLQDVSELQHVRDDLRRTREENARLTQYVRMLANSKTSPSSLPNLSYEE